MKTATMDETRITSLQAMVEEMRNLREEAEELGRFQTAEMYRVIEDRAKFLRDEERRLRAGPPAETRRRDEGIAERPWQVVALLLAAFAVLMTYLTGCASPGGGALEATSSYGAITERGKADLGDLDSLTGLGVGGELPPAGRLGEETGARGEWWLEYAEDSAAGADMGTLGVADVEGYLLSGGLGLRFPVAPRLDLGVGLALTVADGRAESGTASRDVEESGAGAYAQVLYSVPLGGALSGLVGARYVYGPEVEVAGEDVDLSRGELLVGIRWGGVR